MKLKEVKEKYFELLFSVETKYPNETRHETALRYIKKAESRDNNSSKRKD